MKNIDLKLEQIADRVRCCVNCGSVFAVRTKLLCQKCLLSANKDQSQRPFIRQINSETISGYSLWDWIPERNDSLSKVLITLKGGTPKIAINSYVSELLKIRLTLGGSLTKDLIIIPAPSTAGGRDHASTMAECLGELISAPTLKVLRKTRINQEVLPASQREKTKKQRQMLQIELIENFTPRSIENKKVIFVDDVVTTGATALQSRRALGKKKDFEVWCMANRLASCGIVQDLL